MQSSRRAGRDYNTGQEICCANKGEEGDRAATAARGSPPSIRNGPTETQRRDVAVLWFLSAPPASAPEFTPRLFVAAPHPAFSQQPAAAPGAFTLPANVPRRRPRCCCLRPIGATVAHVRRLRVRIAYRSLNNVDVVIGTPTGELPPALGGGAARRPGAALRPLASSGLPWKSNHANLHISPCDHEVAGANNELASRSENTAQTPRPVHR